MVDRLVFAVVVDFVGVRAFLVARDLVAGLLFCVVGFRTFADREVVAVDLFAVVLEDLAAFDLIGDLAVFDLTADLVVVDLTVFRGDRADVVFRVVADAFVARLTVFFDAVVLLFVAVAGLLGDVVRVVDAALDFVVVTFEGVDFFRADEVLVVFDLVVFRFVVVAFLVAIVSLPAK